MAIHHQDARHQLHFVAEQIKGQHPGKKGEILVDHAPERHRLQHPREGHAPGDVRGALSLETEGDVAQAERGVGDADRGWVSTSRIRTARE